MSARKEGFYWVRNDTKWSVAEWVGDGWFVIGSELLMFDYVFDEIGKRFDINIHRRIL